MPLRVFLKPYALTPTYRATNKFTVKYFLNLVLVDEEDRRYVFFCVCSDRSGGFETDFDFVFIYLCPVFENN